MIIINATPHTVTFKFEDKEVLFRPSGLVARVSQEKVNPLDSFFFLPVLYAVQSGEVEGLPQQDSYITYIVSTMVLNSANRNDLIAPLDLVRDSSGVVQGCKSFSISVKTPIARLKQLNHAIARYLAGESPDADLDAFFNFSNVKTFLNR